MRQSVFALALLAACGSSDRDRGNGARVPSNCGNDEIDNGEVCDGANFGGATCTSLGLGAGVLSCAANCKGYNTADCVQVNNPVCGNGTIEGTEVCDGADQGGATCPALGYTGGTLGCAPDCHARITTGCTGTCTPACGARVCGPDPSCGSSCGTCSTGTCNASGICEDGTTTTGAPVIISFTTNVTTYRSGDLIFSAIVTDPDGVDDLIGGQLTAPGGGTYGAFATAAQEGAYSLTLSRQALNQVDPLNGPNTGVSRTFRAQFFDAAGHSVAAEVLINVRCPADAESLCDGNCLALETDLYNCGACGRSCETVHPVGVKGKFGRECSAGLCVFRTLHSPAGPCQTACAALGGTCTSDPGNPSFFGTKYYDCEQSVDVMSCADPNPATTTIGGLSCNLVDLSCVCGF